MEINICKCVNVCYCSALAEDMSASLCSTAPLEVSVMVIISKVVILVCISSWTHEEMSVNGEK